MVKFIPVLVLNLGWVGPRLQLAATGVLSGHTGCVVSVQPRHSELDRVIERAINMKCKHCSVSMFSAPIASLAEKTERRV